VDHAGQAGLEPEIEQKQWTQSEREDRWLQIIQPESADGDAVLVHNDVAMYVARLGRGRGLELRIGDGRGGYLYVIDGNVAANGEHLTTGDAARITGSGELIVEADAVSELLLVDTPL
jgi:redox-sensitive bicupin YhaK (pirin superfamily)